MLLSVLVVSRTASLLNEMVKSIKNATTIEPEDLEILCSWNGDESEIKHISSNSFYKINIAQKEKYNFARNINSLARKSKGRLILIINDDVILDSNSIDNAIKCLKENKNSGLIGSRLRDKKNRITHAGILFNLFNSPYHRLEGLVNAEHIILNQVELKRVAICHSLGSHLIDEKVLHSATHVVLINSFSRFIPSGKEHRPVQIALNRMMNTINTPNESAMLRKFHIKAYKPNHIDIESIDSNLLQISDAGRLRLKNDLIRLINSDSLPIGLNSYANVLIVNSEQDYILTNQAKAKLAEDLRNHLEIVPKIINLQEEGHSITKIKNIKKIKHWLEFDHAQNMV